MLIDSHAHLADDKLLKDIDSVIKNSQENGVQKIITIGCSLSEIEKSKNIADQFKNVFYTAGLYPLPNKEEFQENNNDIEIHYKKFLDTTNFDEIVAIGECGLDYSSPPPWEYELSKELQKDLFIRQIKLSQETEKPFIIHSRNSTEDTLNLVSENTDPHSINGVWHCFTENIETLQNALNLGLMISFTGIITYPNAKDLIEVVKETPLEKIMIETDSPYLTPHKARSSGIKVNSPQYVKMVAEEIAEIKGIPYNIVEGETTKNAERFFGIE